MITIEQCRAARGLLDWTQQDLADASGLSKTAINNFEKGNSDMKAESLKAVRRAFEVADIEFEQDYGLRKRRDRAEILSGTYAMTELMDDILITLDQTGEELLILQGRTLASSSPALHASNLQSQIAHLINQGITPRIIQGLQSEALFSDSHVASRYMKAADQASAITSFIYGTKLALQLWDKDIIIIIDSLDASNAERARFEMLWESQNEQKSQTQSA